jgi:glycerol-1-phosphate dehydrogenase [NAD(P)+]
MATAPGRMNAAGVADFLSKCASAADWYTAHFLRGDYYCRRSSDLLARGTVPVLAAAAGVGRRDVAAVEALANALMISGLSLLLAGSSAPGSGGEHLISHYLDMKHALRGTPNDLHGAQVGVGTVHCLGLWQRILALDTVNLDVEACVAAQPSAETIETWIRDDWGPVVGAEVLAQWREKALDAGGTRAEVAKFVAEIDQRREVLEGELLAPEAVEEAIAAAGGPRTPEGLDAPVEEYHKALRYARFIRNRFTVLDLAAELGMR